jgi:RND family efflux transporter MFP subunit
MSTEIPDPIGHNDPPPPAKPPEPRREPAAQGARLPTHQVLRLVQRFAWRVGGLILVLAISIVIWIALSGHAKPTSAPAESSSVVPVHVARIMRQDLYNEVTITAEFRPFLKVELHAKVSGYVDEINVDIGDRVKSGELLARLEVPELRDELARAKAAEQRAEADYKDAHLVYTRLLRVDKEGTNLIAQQELDAAEAKDLTTQAAIAAANAEVSRYGTLLAYTRITAPFDGVITHRYADPGALIQAGTASDTQSMPLVCLADNYRLRLDSAISVTYVKDIHLGDQVDVQVDSLPGKSFTGTISRFTQRVDDDTRTMVTEIDVPNPNLEIVPGMYATALFKLNRRPNALVIPTDAVSSSSDQKTSVYVVNQAHQIEEQPVKLGLETSDKYEVLAGLREGDLVIVSGHSQVRPGQKVEPNVVDPAAQP